MAENLNYNASGSKCGNGSSLSDANTATCDAYGRLYHWSTAMNNSASSSATPSGVRGVCPEGWHIPSDSEWDVLMTAVGGSSTAGTKLKATSGWNSNGNGTDDFGFAALPGGYGGSGGGFIDAGNYGGWWSSTEDYAGYAYYRYMYYYYEDVRRYNINKTDLHSVRCLQD
jgi:uncharacterized protein (TIGR02145 family)